MATSGDHDMAVDIDATWRTVGTASLGDGHERIRHAAGVVATCPGQHDAPCLGSNFVQAGHVPRTKSLDERGSVR